uniref:Uncharacterized protein n=1 Tax=Candidatus Kentrum sp. MB TaxID=2138164 RepID=A0A450XFK1_9GAMM|nr:MAG: hypothetical protein BECKMB1821I_GA0114274_100577 [Candidatus Kentron sp. MB]
MHNHHIPTLGFVAWSGMGKTTLLIGLIPYYERSLSERQTNPLPKPASKKIVVG